MIYTNLEIIVTNAVGSTTQTFPLTVNPAAVSKLVLNIPTGAGTGTPDHRYRHCGGSFLQHGNGLRRHHPLQ
jgi:hypothetical protein